MIKKSPPNVSIIIVSYNTKQLILDCIRSVVDYCEETFEIIISDNGSTDGTIEAIRNLATKKVKVIENNHNLGFAKGNNVGRNIAQGKYILFLNPDTLLQKNSVKATIQYLKEHPEVGAVTCKVVLPNGELDKDTRRSFPTPLISLTHFSGLDRLFPNSKIFSKYWYGYLSPDQIQEIDSMQGAFFLSKKEILDKVNWFDEDYFLDGEDIDLCWKIKHAGYKNVYFPGVSIIHIKKGSKSKNKSLRSVVGGVKAMEIFYKKRMWKSYPLVLNILVIFGIKLLIVIRTIKYYVL